MKSILICCLFFVLSGLLLAQQSRDELIQKLKSRTDIKVTESAAGGEKDILKIEYPHGKIMYKNIGDYITNEENRITYSPNFDSTIIDLRTIDTTLYYHKYSFWQEVPISNPSFDHLRIDDVNSSGRPELYGLRKYFWSDFEPTTVYELNESGSFDSVHQYDSVFRARSIYDVDKDGNKEVVLTLPPLFDTVGNQQRFFSKVNDTSLAIQLNFTLTFQDGSQLNDITLGNFDGDKYTDLILVRFSTPSVYIFEYNPIINNFDSVYRFDVFEQPPWGNSGFSINDFDLDGKTDIVFGTGRGNVFVIENEGDNQYTNSWQGSVESFHAYVHTWTNDIDGNGKPEFWVLADAYYNGIGTTRITIFETNGDNSYHTVGRIDLVGIFSFYAGTMQAVDIDGDGTEEIAICIDQNFLILKFNGTEEHHTYELYYIKQNEIAATGGNSVYFGAIMYDLLGNGNMNVLISLDEGTQGNTLVRYFTQIYKPDSTTFINIDDNLTPNSITLLQNYPNPFNPSTNIKFRINEREIVSIKVHDILGKEIKLLLDENLPSGEYTIQWDGKDNKGTQLSAGVYFIQMIAGEYRQTIKSVLLK